VAILHAAEDYSARGQLFLPQDGGVEHAGGVGLAHLGLETAVAYGHDGGDTCAAQIAG